MSITKEECDRLRAAAHEAPMNKVFTDHNGHRHLGSHSMAWARAGREWCEAMDALKSKDS